MSEAMPILDESDDSRQHICAMLFPHATLVLSYELTHKFHWMWNLLMKVSVYETYIGSYQDAYQHVVQSCKIVHDNQGTIGEVAQDYALESKSALGVALGSLGKYNESKEILEQTLERQEKLYGNNSSQVMFSLIKLGYALFNVGEFGAAAKNYQRLIDLPNIASLGLHRILFGLSNFARTLSEMRMYKEAERLCRRALKEASKKWSKNTLVILACIKALGICLLYQGQYKDAISLFQRAVQGFEEIYGTEHPIAMSSYQGLALALKREGRYDEAKKIYLRSIDDMERSFGPSHPNTLITANNLGCMLLTIGNLDEALKVLRRALLGAEEVFGKNHVKTIQLQGNLANVLQIQGKYTEAEQLYCQALDGQNRVPRLNCPITLEILDNLVICLEKQEKWEEAEKYSRERSKVQEKLDLQAKEDQGEFPQEDSLKAAYIILWHI